MEGGWEGRGKKALNRERNGLFLKTCATELVYFTANVLLFKVLPSLCLFLLHISFLFLSHVVTLVTAALRGKGHPGAVGKALLTTQQACKVVSVL